MAKENIQDKRFPFLHSHIAREPHILEVLNEIMTFQNNVLKTGIGHLATLEDLKTSRNIKIPFTIARNKIIANLIDILMNNYPDMVRMIILFAFSVEPDTKKLSIIENHEYSVLLTNEEFNRLQSERNQLSADNFLNLISQFRLFNLTKLLKKAKERALLSQVVKIELGQNVFTYKNYSMNRQSVEIAEDFCFHRNNYESVKNTMSLEKMNKVIANHSVPILRRLKNFGILNTDFSDYRDTKLDYLLNILLQDLYLTLSDSELTEVKNFNSLRACILKVETLIDPIITASNDIVAYIRECRICSATALTSVFNNLTEDKLLKWADENGPRYKIMSFKDEDNIVYIIDGNYLMPRLTLLHDMIINHPENIANLNHVEKVKIFDEINLLCNVGKNLLLSDEKVKNILEKDDTVKMLRKIIEEYEDYQNSLSLESAIDREERATRKRRSIFEAISDFFKSLFASKKEEPYQATHEKELEHEPGAYRPAATGETKNIIFKIKNNSTKIIPLSNYIDLLPANEEDIDIIINDVRKLNLKIVIPIYYARKVLYPKRSQQYLIPDMEYLLVNPEIVQSPELIREFTDSLAGETIKDEKLSAQAIFGIEKYLMAIHTQRKAQMMKKTKAKKSL
jgi:hypothetical protein